jgi:methylglutaconyl-CoA hydratase
VKTGRLNSPESSEPLIATARALQDFETAVELALNRPAKRNALNLRTLELLHECLRDFAPTQILLTGRGPAFCSGLDLDECERVATWPVRLRHLEFLEAVYAQLLMTPAHTLAFVQGFAVGGGVGLAACADRVIAASTARFRIPQGEFFTRARLVLPVTSARQVASHNVECWLSGEIDAAKALECGLVDEVLKPDEFARRLIEIRTAATPKPAPQASWRSPKVCQQILTEMQEIMAAME